MQRGGSVRLRLDGLRGLYEPQPSPCCLWCVERCMQLSVQKLQAYMDWKDFGGGQSCPWGRIGGDSDTKEMYSSTLRVGRNGWGR